MTSTEMHISIRGMLSQVNAGARRSYQDEEIDEAINRQIRAFISKRIVNYLNKEQQSLGELVTLVENRMNVPALVKGPKEYLVPFSANHGSLLSPIFYGKNDCTTLTPGTNSAPVYEMLMPKTTRTTPPYYASYQISVDGTVVFDIQDAAKGGKADWAGVTDKDAFLQHMPLVYWFLQQNDVYVNRTETEAKPGYLSSRKNLIIVIDGTPTLATTRNVVTQQHTGTEREFYGDIVTPFALDEMKRTPYFGTAKNKLFYTMVAPGLLRVFVPTGVILTEVELNCVRKPRPVNVILNSDCDLPDTEKVHDTICVATVSDLMGNTADERYPIKARQEAELFNNIA